MMIQGTTGGVFTCVVTGDAVRCLSRLCPPTGAGNTTAAVSTPLSLCSSVDSSSAGAGASGHYSIVVLYCAAAAAPATTTILCGYILHYRHLACI